MYTLPPWLGAGALAAAAWLAAWAAGLDGVALALKPWPVLLAAVGLLRVGGPRAFVLGLGLSALGDVLIEGNFLAGMVAFALAHLAYLAGLGFAPLRPALLLPFAAWAALVWGLAREGLGPLAFPVLGYAAVLATMMWRAAARGGALALGAAVFGLSDSLIALKLGGWTALGHPLAIMATYWGGQALIAWGARERAGGAARPSLSRGR